MSTVDGIKVFNRWKIVLAVSGFNLLFEYSLRGINDLRLYLDT
jgi:hypothetical protein